MRLRIFSLILAAFGLVILLSVGGMLAFFSLAVANFERDNEHWGPPMGAAARSEVRELAEFYRRTGSWEGVEATFAVLEERFRDHEGLTLVLVNREGRVVISSSPQMPPGTASPTLPIWVGSPLDRVIDTSERTLQTFPIQGRGNQRVGALVLIYAGVPAPGLGMLNLVRGLLLAGVTLALGLLGLATLFSGRISRPLRQLDGAARALAAGNLQTRVASSMVVREVADLAESFNRMAEALAQADQQRRQLTADVAHELRTPLSVIKGRLEGIQDGVYRADEPQVNGLLSEVALLERLIEDLRLLALADTGQLALYAEPLDAAQLLHDTAHSFAPEAALREVALRVEAPSDLPELHADPQRIMQVLGNLMSNALRHTPTGGTVTLRVTAEAHGQTFTIEDTGSGINPADLPHIFDRFYRADRSRTRARGGAGLGLAIARRLVEAHGGQIWATSMLGQGTQMSFRLPGGEA
ncbi:MAG: HAMP domain-containing protein [Candidatus Viridilinea halotolerans]|uniref:histidine kinase n=1 Tax=Candidatus Viridilinea halotolerans TaxID=2491704 RepID=A0A426UB91_9CHLR|nr:MAG: HAMP domain-containing protein [Candidatus Viridilinea halotolerans]